MESETFNIFIIGLTKENILFILDYMNYLVVYDTTAVFFALNKYFISRIHSWHVYRRLEFNKAVCFVSSFIG